MFETLEEKEVQDFGKPNLKDRLVKLAILLGVMAVILVGLLYSIPAGD